MASGRHRGAGATRHTAARASRAPALAVPRCGPSQGGRQNNWDARCLLSKLLQLHCFSELAKLVEGVTEVR